MSVENKDLASGVIDWLRASVANKTVSEDYAESMDVAIDCIADAFEIKKDEISLTNLGGKSLPELVAAGLAGGASTSTKTEAPKTIDPETKAKADEFKLQGNRAMAAKNFDEAIEMYTKAIELDNTNVVYLSNRAAAHSSKLLHDKAVEDAQAAIELDPKFSKSYSRLGLAKYALGDAKGAMEAYKKGLEVEGDKKSDAMQRGYDTAKRRVEEELEGSMKSDVATSDSNEDSSSSRSGAGAGAGGGMPDLSSMFGGAGGGGMPNFSELLNNPQLMQAAQQMMQNPDALQGLMNNPMLRNMAQNMGLGGENGQMPDMSELMNNPMLRNMANQFMGGQGGQEGQDQEGQGNN